MIVCFLKKTKEVGAKCYIEKFLERIWFDESGNAEVQRTIILRVSPDSLQSLSGFCMLADRKHSDVDISDISNSGLDQSFYWNQRESKPLEITDLGRRVITYDGLSNVYIPNKNTINTTPFGKFSLLEIAFNQAYDKGKGIFLRLKIKTPRFAEMQPNGNLNFDVRYLSLEGAVNVLNQLDSGHREIEVLSIVDDETKLGGFDVFLTPPEGFQITAEFLSPNMRGRTTRSSNGIEITPRFNRYWRLRFALSGRTLKKTDTGLSIAGAAIKDDLADRLTQLSKNEKDHHKLNIRWHIIAIAIGSLALIIGLLGLLLSVFLKK